MKNIIGNLTKKSPKIPDNMVAASTTDISPHIDYMEYFFQKRDKGFTTKAKLKLDTLSHERLREIGVEVLSVTFHYMRFIAHRKDAIPLTINNLDYYQAIMWHLSDSAHNIPRNLDNREDLVYYIVDFLGFLHCFEKLEDKPLLHRIRPEENLFYFYRKILSD